MSRADELSPPDHVRERLKYLRDRVLHVTTEELAARLGEIGVNASNASVSRYERADPLPRADYIAALARLSGYSTDWILFGKEPKVPGREDDWEMLTSLAAMGLENPERAAELLRVIAKILAAGKAVRNGK